MSHSNQQLSLKGAVAQSALFRYKVGVRRNGEDIWLTDWKENLILDSGLNKVAASTWAACFGFALFGNSVSPTPVRRDGGAITFSQSTTTVTASGSFFSAADVGRLLKYGSGTAGVEQYITAFGSATSVTVTTNQTVSAGTAGTIWYVNNTAVGSVFQTTSTASAVGGDNFTSSASNVVTMQRTLVCAAAPSATTLTEIGFSQNATNSNIFDYDLISPTVAVIIGDQALAKCQLVLTITPNTSTAAGNVGTGCNTAGNCTITGLGLNGIQNQGLSYVTSSGSAASGTILEPSVAGSPSSWKIFNVTHTLGTFTSGDGPSINASAVSGTSIVLTTYIAGNFFTDRTVTFDINTANGSIFGIALGNNASAFEQVFTASFTKSNTQTFTYVMRTTWQRILTN